MPVLPNNSIDQLMHRIRCASKLICLIFFLISSRGVFANSCPAPLLLGQSPSRLVVVVPATGQSSEQWQSFLNALKKEPESSDLAWLIFEHGIKFTSLGNATDFATLLDSCIDGTIKARSYKKITLIGHSIGGMLVRHAYLEAAGAFPWQIPPQNSWAHRVDRILLFASVNKGVQPKNWWQISENWLLRAFPHPQFVLEDFLVGSDFIADIRIAWIRYFGELYKNIHDVTEPKPPHVVQFWGSNDSIITEKDNADIEAFSGPVIVRISDAQHGDINRLDEGFTQNPEIRWAQFRHHLFDEIIPNSNTYAERRFLFIARGIRDSSNSDWVKDLRSKAIDIYGKNNVEDIEYGYFSAAQFAIRPLRAKNIPIFRDRYTERLAENPLTEFDFIGHSNGTYILGQSLLSTPSMRFRNVVLAAPVLPTDFDWTKLLKNHQVEAVRYDTALWDWPVGILCPALRALGFTDVGPSGVVLFGEGTMVDPRIMKVGWYDGNHGAALRIDSDKNINNRQHLLNFVKTGSDLDAGEKLSTELGFMQRASRATPYVVWVLLGIMIFMLYQMRRSLSCRNIILLFGIFLTIYIILDIA